MTAVYLWKERGSAIRKYERRTTLCRAPDEPAAVEKLLAEAKEYAVEGIEFLGDYVLQDLSRPPGGAPVEVAHELSLGIDPVSGRKIEPLEYLESKWNRSRIKDCEVLGIEHSWYNQDGEHSACHNCEVIRKGMLWRSANTTQANET